MYCANRGRDVDQFSETSDLDHLMPRAPRRPIYDVRSFVTFISLLDSSDLVRFCLVFFTRINSVVIWRKAGSPDMVHPKSPLLSLSFEFLGHSIDCQEHGGLAGICLKVNFGVHYDR